MDPERITRGVISLTTGDSRRGSLGSIFRFLGLCVCLGVQRGLSRVLIKYSGNVRLQSESYDPLCTLNTSIPVAAVTHATLVLMTAPLDIDAPSRRWY